MIDWTKPVETEDGKQVEIFTTKARGIHPVVGQVEGEDFIRCWSLTGFSPAWGILSLVNVKETITRWVNFYLQEEACDHKTRADADKAAYHKRIACIKVEFKEGEGL